MRRGSWVDLMRVAVAALSVAGLVVQLVIAVRTDFSLVSFWSYFTNLSNLLGSVVLVTLAVRHVRGIPDGPRLTTVRGAAVVYLAFVGLVFNTLLRDADLGDLQPWVNVVHHLVMPVWMVLDWVLWPPGRRIDVRTTLLWAVFPAVYAVYCIVRGAATGFYPYPFFNPGVGGPGLVALYCAVMLVAFVGLAFAVRALGARRARIEG